LSEGLRSLGASVQEIPFIEIRPPRSYKNLDESLKLIAEYHWLILTSVNGVRAFLDRLSKLNILRRQLSHLNIAAIGPATRAALEKEGFKVAVVPSEYVAEAIVEALSDKIRGQRVLLCRARVARDVIPIELRRLGAALDVVEAYETLLPPASRVELRSALHDTAIRPHLITFTSSSTVNNYVSLLGIRSGRSNLVKGILNASIGPVTSATLLQHQLSVDLQAVEYTIPGLIRAICERARQGVPIPPL
jgi:uroporphyrinogen-III synthase